MGKDICPFLTREENQETACIREKCYIYDAKSKSCKLTTLSGDISADYKELKNVIGKSGSANGKMLKKMGSMMNKTYKPLTEFLENTAKGEALLKEFEAQGVWREENTELLRTIADSISKGAVPGEAAGDTSEDTVSARGTDYSEILSGIKDNVEKQYEAIVAMSGSGEVLGKISELNSEILDKITAFSMESDQEKFNETIKMLLDTLKKPLAASLKIQQEISVLAVSIKDDLKNGTGELRDELVRQGEALKETAGSISSFFEEKSALLEERFAPLENIMTGIYDIREFMGAMTEGVSKVTERMSELAESQTRLNNSFEKSMELFKRFIEVQEQYFENEESSVTLRRAEKLNDSGLSLLMNGDYEGAVDYFKDALRLNSRLWGAYSNMGLAFSENGEKEKAAAVFKKLINMNPEFSEGYYNLGMVLFENEKNEEAVELFKKTIAKNPDFSKAYVALGDALFESESYDSAMSAWKKALGLDPTLDDVRKKIEGLADLISDEGEDV